MVVDCWLGGCRGWMVVVFERGGLIGGCGGGVCVVYGRGGSDIKTSIYPYTRHHEATHTSLVPTTTSSTNTPPQKKYQINHTAPVILHNIGVGGRERRRLLLPPRLAAAAAAPLAPPRRRRNRPRPRLAPQALPLRARAAAAGADRGGGGGGPPRGGDGGVGALFGRLLHLLELRLELAVRGRDLGCVSSLCMRVCVWERERVCVVGMCSDEKDGYGHGYGSPNASHIAPRTGDGSRAGLGQQPPPHTHITDSVLSCTLSSKSAAHHLSHLLFHPW